jgi:hypothetical protein
MRRLFADTFFYIALLSRGDESHQRALSIYQAEDFDQIVTTAFVLTELADGMADEWSRQECARFIEYLRQSDETAIIEASAPLYWKGFDLYSRRPDKEWSLTDCISFVVMSDERLNEALTGDRHFEQAGFTALLGK